MRQPKNAEMQNLNQTLQESRQSLQPLAPVADAMPVTHPQAGMMPIGCPMVLNPDITRGGILYDFSQQQWNPAPWLIRMPLLNIPVNNPLNGFKNRMWCITCDNRRHNHEPGESFGEQCKMKRYCSKCFQHAGFHVNGARMGVFCPFPADRTNRSSHLWYG
jgi:hypothetical protein